MPCSISYFPLCFQGTHGNPGIKGERGPKGNPVMYKDISFKPAYLLLDLFKEQKLRKQRALQHLSMPKI